MEEITQPNELSLEDAANITLQVAEFEMNALAKVLKSKDITFRSEGQLAAFVRKRLFKDTDEVNNTITYRYCNMGSTRKKFLFQIVKTITTNEEGGAILNLNVELDENKAINPASDNVATSL
jgi:hypothetical protein